MSPPTFLVHIATDGTPEYHLFGAADACFLVVDERAPNDRVYRLTVRTSRERLQEIIGDSPVGDRFEARHAALEHRIVAAAKGEPALSVVRS